MKNLAILAFIAMILAQWAVPGKMIYDSERVISEGVPYKFKTQPIDPSDPFRGKYITLSFDVDHVAVEKIPDNWHSGDDIYVTYTTDSAGFAKVQAISPTKPESGDYLFTTVNFATTYEPYEVSFNLPFNRFYLEESKASQAEQLYWEAQRDSAQVAYGVVKLKGGSAVLTDVMINDKSVVDIITDLNADQ